jgi:hypothetical protein
MSKIMPVILALATLIGGVAAIDYFCDACIKNFIGAFKSKPNGKYFLMRVKLI